VRRGTDSVTFEQTIDAEAPGESAVLRIDALFAESPGGVTLTLWAEELRASADGTTERHDVTRRYRDNLLNALDSLASKWGLRAGGAPATRRPADSVPAPLPAGPTPTLQPPVPQPFDALSFPPQQPVPSPTLRSSAANADGPAPQPGHQVGAWAYYAERYAVQQGCTLGDLGAVLEGNRDGAELHRVHCADGRQIRVRCLAGVCRAAP